MNGILLPCIALFLLLAACGDLIRPDLVPGGREGWPDRIENTSVVLFSGMDEIEWGFKNSERCEWEEDSQGKKRCMCALDPITVPVGEPEDPWFWDPGEPPWPAEPPGWPSYGDSPTGPPPGEQCDWGCPTEVSASLTCDTGVARGGEARCDLEVDPASMLDHVYGWTSG